MFCFYPGNGDTIAFKYAYLSGIGFVKKNNGCRDVDHIKNKVHDDSLLVGKG